MELQGRIVKVLPLQSGVSQKSGNEWRKQEYVFGYYESPSDIYERHVIIGVMGDRIEQYALHEGDYIKVRISLGITETSEGRYFNQIRTGDITVVRRAAQQAGTSEAQEPQQTVQGQEDAGQAARQQQGGPQENVEGVKGDDLPF